MLGGIWKKMEVSTMISTSENRMIAEGRRLHCSIMSWAAKHGLWAYRVLTPTDSWFELYNPKTRKVSLRFPAKIEEAIGRCRAELAAYADWSRSSYPPAAGPSSPTPSQDPKGRGDDGRDCNAEKRFAISGKTAEIGPSGVSGCKIAAISAAIALAAALACNFAPCGEIRTSPAVIAGGAVDFEKNFLTDFFFGGGARVSYVAGRVEKNGGKQNG